MLDARTSTREGETLTQGQLERQTSPNQEKVDVEMCCGVKLERKGRNSKGHGNLGRGAWDCALRRGEPWQALCRGCPAGGVLVSVQVGGGRKCWRQEQCVKGLAIVGSKCGVLREVKK